MNAPYLDSERITLKDSTGKFRGLLISPSLDKSPCPPNAVPGTSKGNTKPAPHSPLGILLFFPLLVVTIMTTGYLIKAAPIDQASRHASTERVKFDFYLVASTYQPEFCYKHDDWPGCKKPDQFWQTHLTIHGLWPQNRNGTYPTSCSNEDFDPNSIAGYLPQMLIFWPNVKADYSTDTKQSYTSFWAHEWEKHGTCSGLSQKEYFHQALNHYIHTPPLLGRSYGKSVAREDLLNSFGGQVVLRCAGNAYLEEVRACVSSDNDGVPLERFDCPPDMEDAQTNCPETIKISKFHEEMDGELVVPSTQ